MTFLRLHPPHLGYQTTTLHRWHHVAPRQTHIDVFNPHVPPHLSQLGLLPVRLNPVGKNPYNLQEIYLSIITRSELSIVTFYISRHRVTNRAPTKMSLMEPIILQRNHPPVFNH
ncbi:hypothetical protein [Phascolarctid gammaherpesvirus 1]|uniref:Uncharacterized protein n=1 Tax=Phascolarctid gammaherpesvirus 1 TaxID=2249313 RepID=A0A3Q8J617_9GAMA|nr:hypothetical protein KM711_gp69 [Phascolarctid gammaherpesvirus 1]AZB49245.1 hypothetical protein [Phascolarctid gammaherpesvirus 1]